MKRGANAPAAYEDVIRSIGAPNKMVNYNSQVLTGETWNNINLRYVIDTYLAISYHKDQNYCEVVGGHFKLAVIKMFHYTPNTPL